jgi:hypothetical protein
LMKQNHHNGSVHLHHHNRFLMKQNHHQGGILIDFISRKPPMIGKRTSLLE